MKRSQERDMSPRVPKRSRYPGPDYEMMRKSPIPEYDRRDLRMSPPPRSREMKYYHDDVRPRYREDDYPIGRTELKTPEYRSLCLSGISSKIPDHAVKDALYREFKKFGEFNVNITYTGEMRVAYINFRYPEDAREAKHAKHNKLVLFERLVVIESVYPKKHHGAPSGAMSTSSYARSNEFLNYPGGSSSRRSSPPFQPRRSYPSMRSPEVDVPQRKDFGSGYISPTSVRRAPNEKFPYHLDHIPPEEDDKATRTLFVGNLDYNITDEELKDVFEKYGFLEEIDIKRPQRGQGNAYAFIKFMNLDYAHRAKVEMSGQYIGRFQCKIGYGKVTPSTCIWVGGLGPWVTHQMLEREFDRFGIIERIEWPQSKSYAYVLYDNIDAAQAACSEMRGAPLGGQDRRLRIDFADVSHITNTPKPLEIKTNESGRGYQGSNWKPPHERREDGKSVDGSFRSQEPKDERRRSYEEFDVRGPDMPYRRPRTPDGSEDRRRRRSPDKYDGHPQSRDGRKGGRVSDEEFDVDGGRRDARRLSAEKEYSDLEEVENISEMVKCLPVAWNGGILLKNSAFPGRMHVVSGDVTIVDTLMRDPTTTETPMLKIKQRLRLDPPKLDDVGRRVVAAGRGGHCILYAMPSTLPNWDDSAVQQRPLKNLVTYLRQKEAAGVISLPPYETKDKDNVGVLYAFPPCAFGYEYLRKAAPRLPAEPIQDDYLIVVVIRGTV